ncbi:zona pellucida sperm-binding protein 3 [Melanotaenia boesemani]|uniref:zona pellucida sperm-binding protein 3 n=1 Tax=Melanotaenia boesemani TaxID=1250792 RepID=UPI001C05AE91|nr:zona pellucida sperm-binding protein 3 [Melanotaenia boesemani]
MKPEKGARDVPKWLKTVLLGIPPTFSDDEGATHTPDLVEILCHFDRIYVRVRREFFKSKDAFKYLKLGTCSVNYRNKDYYFLMHSLKTDCGFKIESFPNYLSVSITFHYKPTSTVLREIPFDILLQCKYPRWFYSYKVGFHPKLQGGTLYRALQTKGSFTITPQDASGNEISGFISYSLGHPMYFEASGPDRSTSSGDKRMYINNCFVTASKDPYSHPNYTVIANQGCMIDGKLSMQSKFLAGDSKMVQKFSVGAFIFKDSSSTSPQRFYMHCKMSVGPLTPSESSKACNYDHATHKWKELYGKDSVCKCCESTCSSAKPKTASEDIISSHPWKVDFSSEDEYQEADPQMKTTHAEKVSLEDPHMEEHTESTTMSVAKM